MKSDKTHIAPRARRHARRGDNADLLALAEALRTARTGAGMTQDQLALVCGVGRDTVIALENARPGVSLGMALQILKGFRLTIAAVPLRRRGGRR